MALVAQLDRAAGFEPAGREPGSLRAHRLRCPDGVLSEDSNYMVPYMLRVRLLRADCLPTQSKQSISIPPWPRSPPG